MIPVLGWLCVGVLLLVSLLAVYQWALAMTSILLGYPRKAVPGEKQIRFLILIPAHNEEYGLPNTLESLTKLQYPKELVHVIVVADRCDDATAMVARRYGIECLERLEGPPGKGAAIAWTIEELRRNATTFDALVILDADTVAERRLLEAFNEGLLSGHEIQQGYNYLSNPWATAFTRIIAVTSVLRNGFFYTGKSRIGLSAMLTGTGMCFSRQVIERHGWTAFSVGEDWEFSVSLLLAGEKIHFNPNARVLARESHNFKQASTQRLRWASGRHAVAASSAWELIVTGLRLRRPYLLDAALTLLAPNYSTQATLAILGLFTAWFLSGDPVWHFLFPWAALLIGFLGAYFLLGVVFTEAPLRTLAGIALIPIFLPWRIAIEALGFLGYGRKRWVRTSRAPASRQGPDH
jgi:cellulose synthase/poly-beta-1,6-N-acetylglucosamine synthase-like glycosyltransferase